MVKIQKIAISAGVAAVALSIAGSVAFAQTTTTTTTPTSTTTSATTDDAMMPEEAPSTGRAAN